MTNLTDVFGAEDGSRRVDASAPSQPLLPGQTYPGGPVLQTPFGGGLSALFSISPQFGVAHSHGGAIALSGAQRLGVGDAQYAALLEQELDWRNQVGVGVSPLQGAYNQNEIDRNRFGVGREQWSSTMSAQHQWENDVANGNSYSRTPPLMQLAMQTGMFFGGGSSSASTLQMQSLMSLQDPSSNEAELGAMGIVQRGDAGIQGGLKIPGMR